MYGCIQGFHCNTTPACILIHFLDREEVALSHCELPIKPAA